MKWADLDTLPVAEVTPENYRYEQLKRADIEETARCVREWHPDVSVGSASGFHHEAFYRQRASLAGEPERDLIVYVCKHAGRIVSLMSIERDPESLVIRSRLASVSPAHRGSGLARFGVFITDEQSRAMGIAMAYHQVSLKTPYAQQLVERCGFKLVGILPASDREMVEPGVVLHVPEALYAKVYAPCSELYIPADECMTPSVRQMWTQLFE